MWLYLQEIIPAGFEDLEGVVSFEMDIEGVDSGDVVGGGQEAPPTTEEGEEMETNAQYENRLIKGVGSDLTEVSLFL